jgi:tungstate transport system ATP-binding protein
MASPILEARDLVVTRGRKEIVRVERFAVEPAEVRVVIGPNGAGKSTLLRALNGLYQARGELFFEGSLVRNERDRRRLRRRTAAVFQQPFLLATTVRGNVEAGLRRRGFDGDELGARSAAALELLGIAHLAQRRRDGLSGGEAQRVSIARALAGDPVAVFLDEPMAALDPPTRRGLMRDLERIFARRETTVLWVTHDREEAVGVADRVTFLAGGRVVQEGTRGEVFNRPATEEVAEYLGVDVWLEGEVTSGPDDTLRFVLPGGAFLSCAEGEPGPAFACVHPEDVTLFRSPPQADAMSARNVLRATVEEVRSRGRLRLVVLRWQGQPLQALVTRAAADDLVVAPGDEMYAAIKALAVQIIPRVARDGGAPGDRRDPAKRQ